MNKLLVPLIAAVVGLVALPQSAEANSRGRSATVTKRVLKGYDCYNRPIYVYVRQPVRSNYNSRTRCGNTRQPYRSSYRARTYTPNRANR